MPIWLIIVIVIVVTTATFAISMVYVIRSRKPEDIKIQIKRNQIETLELCTAECQNINTINTIKSIIDSIKYSDINSSVRTSDIEKEISDKAIQLLESVKSQNNVAVQQNIEELMRLVSKRNIINKNKDMYQ